MAKEQLATETATKSGSDLCCGLLGTVRAEDAPPWLLAWSALLILFAAFEVWVVPAVRTFDTAAVASPAFLAVSWISTGIFVVDFLAVSWRVVGEDRNASRAFHRYARTWLVCDALVSLPWDVITPGPLAFLPRPLRALRIRHGVAVIHHTHRRYFPEAKSNYFKEMVGIFSILISVLHICACGWCAATRLGHQHAAARENGEEEWISWLHVSGVNNIDLLADDGMLADRGDFFGFNPGRVYLWALYFAATTFTTVGSAVWGAEHMSCA
jgi:hypothetical protein